MILGSSGDRPEIVYPCEWQYKVIGNNVENILAAIEDAAHGLVYTVSPSNVSKNEKYFSINFTIQIPNEVTRDIIYASLVSNENVKIVL